MLYFENSHNFPFHQTCLLVSLLASTGALYMMMRYYRLVLKPWKNSTAKRVQPAPIYDFGLKDENVKIMNKVTGNVINSNKWNQCNFVSYHASNLRKHLKTHSGEKSNKCNQCDYASCYESDLRAHLKTHSGEKPNKCNQCDFASSNADVMKDHSGEKSNKYS